MTSEINSPDRPTQAIFSVCVDESVVNAAATACSKVSGAHFTGEFRDYITANKRPQFSPSLKNATSCVALIDFDRNPELALETTERLHQIFLKRSVSWPSAHSWMQAFCCGQCATGAPNF